MSNEMFQAMQLQISKIQLWITAIAIFIGPAIGVILTFWIQKRNERHQEKHRLFVTLMGNRKSYQIPEEIVRAMNTIDIVYASNSEVLRLWHRYYSLLSHGPSEERNHTWIELLAAMARDLGYKKIKETDLDKFYVPQGHVDQLEFQKDLQSELLRVLKNTAKIITAPSAQSDLSENGTDK